ncbi:hypothetical protein LINPERHAP1_LOCUS26222 [Linum perenne]
MEDKRQEEAVAKKVWQMARVVFFMLRRGISRSRIALDLTLIAKRGNKLAGKAIGNFLTFNGIIGSRHQTTITNNKPIASNDAVPGEYEFSCSNTPASNSFISTFFNFNINKRNKNYHEDVTTVATVQRMLEMINHNNNNNNEAIQSSSPEANFVSAAATPLPWLGKQQGRIMESPSEGGQVDKAADEFIRRFYMDLKSEKAVVMMDDQSDQSPNYNTLWGR